MVDLRSLRGAETIAITGGNMAEYQIEMLWRCPACREENKGRHKECTECGRPKSPNDRFYMPGDTSRAAAVTIPELLALAKAGPDWKCAYCGSAQRRNDGSCRECGAAQPAVALGDNHIDVPAPNADESAAVRRRLRWRLVAAAGAVLATAMLLWWAFFRTREFDAAVAAVGWEHVVIVERYQIWDREGWTAPPGAFDVSDHGKRFSHNEKVPDGTTQEAYQEQEACGQDCRTVQGSCYTTPQVCSDNGNGFATCRGGETECSGDREECTTRYCSVTKYRTVTRYRDEPVYRTWYGWKIWDWGEQRRLTRQGSSTDTHRPSDDEIHLGAGLAEGERERERREQRYEVTFAKERESWRYETASEAELAELTPGTTHRIRVHRDKVELVRAAP